MECTNHGGVAAIANCAGCADPFCANCLVTINNEKYCASCKAMALPTGAAVQGTRPNKLADEALKTAILGICCLGIILGPVAMSKALRAREQIAADPTFTGSGKATAALVIGGAVFLLNILGLVGRLVGQ